MIQLVPRVNGYAGNATVTTAENEIQRSVSQFPDRLSRPLSHKYLWERHKSVSYLPNQGKVGSSLGWQSDKENDYSEFETAEKSTGNHSTTFHWMPRKSTDNKENEEAE